MPSSRGFAPPACLRLPHADIGAVASLDLDPSQVSRFLGPVADIIRAVRGGPSHSLVALFAGGVMVGFYVVHPDPRDASRWWLGWLAIGSRFQGLGLGRAALSSALLRLASIPGCRSVRLLVAPDNTSALALYASGGFVNAGVHPGGELVLEYIPAEAHPAASRSDRWAMVPAAVRARTSRRRVRSTVGPHAARVIGVVRGPPTRLVAA